MNNLTKLSALVKELEALQPKLYGKDFLLTWQQDLDSLKAVMLVAEILQLLHKEKKPWRIFDYGLAISIFRDNSTRTRFSFASAVNGLGLGLSELDEVKSQIAHGETLRETANMISFLTEVIGIRDDMYPGEGHTYMTEVAEAVTDGFNEGVLATASHLGEPAMRSGSPHAKLVRPAETEGLFWRLGAVERQKDSHELGLFALLWQTAIGSPGCDKPDDPLWHGSGAGASQGL